MDGRIKQREAQAFRKRWEIVADAERQEVRTASMAHKLRQLASLMPLVQKLRWSKTFKIEETEVRNRWNRLRRARRA